MVASSSLASSAPQPMRKRVTDYIAKLQETIVTKLETYGSGQAFRRESWTRDEGGGGLSYTLDTSDLSFSSWPTHTRTDHPIEKAAVNTSTMSGILPPAAVRHMSTAHAALKDIDKNLPFFAAGLSLILHPRHPRVPTVHANYRYFEVLDAPLPHNPATNSDDPDPDREPAVLAWWFGVTTDLTPAYVHEHDFARFHKTLKVACDTWSDAAHTALSVYPPFKASCDDYLFIPHRHEHRGIGGVRFDDMDSDAMRALLLQVARGASVSPSEDTIARLSAPAALFGLVAALGDIFLPSFIVILERRIDASVVPSERRWQLLRRGRAVEFNLVERGTKFGLAAPGIMAENVFVGLPPRGEVGVL